MLFFCVLLSLAFSEIPHDEYLVTEALINDIRSKTDHWVPGVNPIFVGKKFSDVKYFLGKLEFFDIGQTTRNEPTNSNPITKSLPNDLPDNFDTYQKWPNCGQDVRDQGDCASYWAFSAANSLSDRYCVSGGAKKAVALSPQDLVSCEDDQYGCQGGQYLEETGIVTETCFPYKSGTGKIPSCPNKCVTKEVWDDVKHKVEKDSTTHFGDVTVAMTNLMDKGSIQAGFTVYQDLFTYKSGVYHHVSGRIQGGYAGKVQGWGLESGVPYWNVATSWGESFGMKGYFWMKRGDYECGFEDMMYAGDPVET